MNNKTSTCEAPSASQPKPSQIGLSIWEKVEKTDPNFTRAMDSSYGGTSINPAYMIKRATEVFGPIGIGFGYKIVQEDFVDGGPLGFSASGDSLGPQRVHILRLQFWYIWEGLRGEFEHFGQTPFVGLNFDRSRVVTDGDVKKKSLTDALTKCLSLVGISSDVHMGMHDDSKYISALICEFGDTTGPSPSKPVRAQAEAQKQAEAEAQSTSTTSIQDPSANPKSGSRRQRSAETTSALTESVQTASEGVQGGLDLGTVPVSDKAQPVAVPSTPMTDVEMWLKRIKSLGTDAIQMSKSTVLSIFSGDDLARVQAALDDRERELTSAT